MRRKQHRRQSVTKKTTVCPLTFQSIEAAGFRELVRRTIHEIDADSASSFGSVVAHFPTLHAELLERAGEPALKDAVRWQYVSNLHDFQLAKRIYADIDSPRYRQSALEKLVLRAPSLEERLMLIEDSYSLRMTADPWSYGPIFALRPYAATAPDLICRLFKRMVPDKDSAFVYTYFAAR